MQTRRSVSSTNNNTNNSTERVVATGTTWEAPVTGLATAKVAGRLNGSSLRFWSWVVEPY
jgi:hypothetical protein